MWYNVILIAIVFIAAFIGFTGYSLAKGGNTNNSALDQLTRIELNNKLEQLPDKPVAEDRPMGAMCYKTAAPPNRAEYTCPICGEMTLYSEYYALSVDTMPSYRNLVKKITKMDVKLDESQFCKECSPNTETPQLCLIVKPDKNSKPKKTCDITKEDINLLYDYSEGIKEHTNSFGKFPLTDYKIRLEELLGIKIINNGK